MEDRSAIEKFFEITLPKREIKKKKKKSGWNRKVTQNPINKIIHSNLYDFEY